MLVRHLFFRILPIIAVSGFTLISFQNCARMPQSSLAANGGLDGTSVSSNPNSGGTVDPINIPIDTPPDNSGGNWMSHGKRFVPVCFAILSQSPSTDGKQINLSIQIRGHLVEAGSSSISSNHTPDYAGDFVSGTLNVSNNLGEIFSAISRPTSETGTNSEGLFVVPTEIVSAGATLSGFFSGSDYENIPLSICESGSNEL